MGIKARRARHDRWIIGCALLVLVTSTQAKRAGSPFGSSGDLAVYSALAEVSASSFLDDKTKPSNVLDGDVRTA
jgi:hypothetical protein